MSPYKIPLPIEPEFVSPFATGERAFRVEAVNDAVDVLAGTRSLTLEITHPGLIWTGEWPSCALMGFDDLLPFLLSHQ